MTFQILLACMHQNDFSILDRSNISCNVIAVNQCDEEKILFSGDKKRQMVYTTQRGLSRGRNCAIDKATADICLLSDDDEVFKNNVDELVLNAYRKHPEADVIAFQVANASSFGQNVENDYKTYPAKAFQCNFLQTLKISSWQISFRRKSIVEKNIRFDECMGSGTGNGGQEESKFLADCHKAGLRIWYVPVEIARMEEAHDSQWFKGFDRKFFYDRGWATRRFMGYPLAFAYALYYVLKKHRMYSKEISFFSALTAIISGLNAPKDR